MKIRKWFWGLFFIVAGVLMLLNALDIILGINILNLLLTILLTGIIVASIMHLNFSGILVPAALIGVLYHEPLGITNLTPWPLIITAILFSIGLEIIFHSSRRPSHYGRHARDLNENFNEIEDSPDAEEVNYTVQFGGGVKYVNTDNLKIAHLNAKCSAMKVYFDNAKVKKNAEIIVDITLSGVELYIPKEWELIIEPNISLSGIEEKNRRIKADGPKVVLKGNVSLSGIEIIYV